MPLNEIDTLISTRTVENNLIWQLIVLLRQERLNQFDFLSPRALGSRHVKQLSRDSGRGGSLKRGAERLSSPQAAAAPAAAAATDQPPSLVVTRLPEEAECDAMAKELMEELNEIKDEKEKKLRAIFGT